MEKHLIPELRGRQTPLLQQKKGGKILLAEDDATNLTWIKTVLEGCGFEVVGVSDRHGANEKLKESFKSGKFFDLAIIDVQLGNDSGVDLAKKIIDNDKRIKLIHITGYPKHILKLPYEPDDCLIKPFNHKTLIGSVVTVLSNSEKSDILANRWSAVENLQGIKSVSLISHKIIENDLENVERLIGVCINDSKNREPIVWVNYQYPDFNINTKTIAISSLIGCLGKCKFCLNWRYREKHFVRQLTKDEMVAQVYLSLLSSKFNDVFTTRSKKMVIVNFACEGDGLVYNLDNCCQAIIELGKIIKPKIDFIITSIGSEDSLTRFIEKYINLPRLTHYWSVNSLDEEYRAHLMPGTAGQSLIKLRDLYQAIAEKTDKNITVSWILIKGKTDQPKDVLAIKKFFGNRPFTIKVMGLVDGSLKGEVATTEQDIDNFIYSLQQENVSCRKRRIMGSKIFSGCGNTIIEWMMPQKK